MLKIRKKCVNGANWLTGAYFLDKVYGFCLLLLLLLLLFSFFCFPLSSPWGGGGGVATPFQNFNSPFLSCFSPLLHNASLKCKAFHTGTMYVLISSNECQRKCIFNIKYMYIYIQKYSWLIPAVQQTKWWCSHLHYQGQLNGSGFVVLSLLMLN